MVKHGDTRIDEYFWLRDRNNPETIAYLEAENRYASEVMAPAAALQESLYNEILGRIKEDDLSVPVRKDDWFYYTRTERGKPYGISCRKRGGLDQPEEILLDANLLAAGQSYFRIGSFSVSPRHDLLAYSIDVVGDEAYTIYVKILATGELLPDSIRNTYDTLEWANDNATFFYTVLDETKRPHRVYRHRLGSTAGEELIYEEQDARFWLGLSKSRSERFIYIGLHSKVTSEIRYIHADEPLSDFAVVLRGSRASSTAWPTTANRFTSAQIVTRRASG
jgi:oligopeptidase B